MNGYPKRRGRRGSKAGSVLLIAGMSTCVLLLMGAVVWKLKRDPAIASASSAPTIATTKAGAPRVGLSPPKFSQVSASESSRWFKQRAELQESASRSGNQFAAEEITRETSAASLGKDIEWNVVVTGIDTSGHIDVQPVSQGGSGFSIGGIPPGNSYSMLHRSLPWRGSSQSLRQLGRGSRACLTGRIVRVNYLGNMGWWLTVDGAVSDAVGPPEALLPDPPSQPLPTATDSSAGHTQPRESRMACSLVMLALLAVGVAGAIVYSGFSSQCPHCRRMWGLNEVRRVEMGRREGMVWAPETGSQRRRQQVRVMRVNYSVLYRCVNCGHEVTRGEVAVLDEW